MDRTFFSTVGRGACASAAFLLSACASPEPGDMVRSWTANFGEMNIVPMFPPREGIQPGDVILTYAIDDVPKGLVPSAMVIDTLGARRAWERHAARRILPPDDAGKPEDVFRPGSASGPLSGAGAAFPGDRFMLAAFPQLEIARTSAASLGLAAPNAPLLVGLGLASSDTVSVRAERVQHFGVPVADIVPGMSLWLQAIEQGRTDAFPAARDALCQSARYLARQLEQSGLSPERARSSLRMSFVTDVFYASGINYVAAETEMRGVQASLALDGAASLKTLIDNLPPASGQSSQPAPGGGQGQQGQGQGQGQAQGQAPAAQQGALLVTPETRAQMEAQIRSIAEAAGGVQGVSGAAFSGFSQRASLAQSRFSRPLAIGWRGLQFAAPGDGPGQACDASRPLRAYAALGDDPAPAPAPARAGARPGADRQVATQPPPEREAVVIGDGPKAPPVVEEDGESAPAIIRPPLVTQ